MMNSKENTKQLSVGTESQYSATSPDVQTGGFISGLFGGNSENTTITNLILKAFSGKKPEIALYLLNNLLSEKLQVDFSQTTKNGLNVLHMLTIYSTNPEAKQMLINLLNNSNAKDYINVQDARGNNVAHLALQVGQNDIVQLLVSLGVKLNVKNNEGYSIANVPTGENVPIRNDPTVFEQMTNTNCTKDNDVKMDNRLVELIKAHRADTDTDGTIGFRRSPDVVTQMYGGSESSEVNSVDVLNMIMNDFKTGKQSGGKSKSDAVIATGKRNMVNYSEVSIGGSATSAMDDDDDSTDENRISEIARAVNNKASEAHDRALERIKEILKVDDIEARAYRSLIFEAIKNENKESSNYEKSMELEKRASDKNVLSSFSKSQVKERMAIIAEKRKNRESESSSKPEKKEKKDKKEPAKKATAKKGKKKESESSASESGLDTMSSINIA